MSNKHVCRDCMDAFKRTSAARKARAENGRWARWMWPDWVYTNAQTRYCPKHHTERLAMGATRRASLLNQMPPWADRRAIRAVYEEAARLTEVTGIPHDVDHIVPLQGKAVRGLHVHWNLRPLPHHENNRKSNKFDERLGLAFAGVP